MVVRPEEFILIYSKTLEFAHGASLIHL